MPNLKNLKHFDWGGCAHPLATPLGGDFPSNCGRELIIQKLFGELDLGL